MNGEALNEVNEQRRKKRQRDESVSWRRV